MSAAGSAGERLSMGTCVLLRHDTPDGAWHYDWLIDRPGVVGGKLRSFRVGHVPWEVGAFEATEMPDHRRVYLTHEGDIGGGRGRVRRVGACEVAYWREEAGHAETVLLAGSGRLRLVGRRQGGGPVWQWQVEQTPAD